MLCTNFNKPVQASRLFSSVKPQSFAVLSPLIEITSNIRYTLGDTISKIDQSYDSICQGIEEDDGHEVVDALEAFIPQFYEFVDKASVLKESAEKLNNLPVKLKTSPSAVELRKVLEAFSSFDDLYYGDLPYKTVMHEAMNADDGSVVNDFLQGHTLTKMKSVADACRAFVILGKHLETIDRLVKGEIDA